jgi:hypothetical protein
MEATYVDGAPVNPWIGVLRLGEIAFTTVNGEAYNEIPRRLKRESPFAETVMVTLPNGAADDVSFSQKTFRVPWSAPEARLRGGRIVKFRGPTSWIGH